MSFFLTSVLFAMATGQGSPSNLTFDAKLKSVAIFRDGYGYFVREGAVKLEGGWATTNFVPHAIKGTVWVYPLDPADKVDTVITTKDNKIAFTSPTDLKAKLADKVNLTFHLTLTNGQTLDGRLNRLLDDMVLLDNGGAFQAVPYSNIREATLVGYPIRIHVTTSKPNKVEKIGVAYLQEGVRWDPSYLLDLNGTSGQLTLRASLQNTTEDFDHTDVTFVVGSPFISNRGLQDIIADVNLAAPAAAAAAGGGFGGGSGAPAGLPMAKDEPRSFGGAKADSSQSPMATLAPEEAGELFYYKRPDMTLDSNDVAMVSIFNEAVTVAPEFDWNADGDQVNYLLHFKNPSSTPLTTGPVFVVDSGRAVGQDTLRYTPGGGSAKLQISQGIGLRVDKTEAEVKRGGPVTIGKTAYIPVTLKGVLSIENHRKGVITITVTKSIRGKVLEVSNGGTIKNTQLVNGEPNPVNDVVWKVEVPANGKIELNYSFMGYMSSEIAGAPVPATPQDPTTGQGSD